MSALLENKKVYFNYEVLESYDAGIELFGFEVKSLRTKKGSLEGSHITMRGGEAYLINAFVPPFQEKNTPSPYDPRRIRRLLLTKKEIASLAGHEMRKGLTIVPLSVYNSKRKIKLKLAVVRGKKKFDKRETIKRRDTQRDVRRELKDR